MRALGHMSFSLLTSLYYKYVSIYPTTICNKGKFPTQRAPLIASNLPHYFYFYFHFYFTFYFYLYPYIFYYTKQYALSYLIIFITLNNHVIVVHTCVDVAP